MSENNSLVSICLITYNHEAYIAQALDSILMQKTSFPIEVIVADDCSKDKTRDIIREYYAKYPGIIRLLFQEKNVGGGLNFVNLINAATGKYIAYLEGDDYWTDENKLQTQYDVMEAHPEYAMCYHPVKWEYINVKPDNEGLESNVGDKPVSDIYDLLKKGWSIRSCSMFFRAMKLPPGFENLYVGDYPLHVLLADKGKIAFINKCMGVYRVHDKGLSETTLLTKAIEKWQSNYRKHLDLLDYMDRETKGKYRKIFNKQRFDITYTHSLMVLKKQKSLFFHEMNYAIKRMGFFFFVKYSLLKSLAFTKSKSEKS